MISGDTGIVYDHFANTCNLTLVIETAAAIIDHHKQYMWRGPIRHKGDRQQKKEKKKGDNWYILFVFVRKFEYRSQLHQTAQVDASPTLCLCSCTAESRHPHPTFATRHPHHPHWLSSPPLLPISEGCTQHDHNKPSILH